MRTVTVKKAALLGTVTENREAHREIFLKAQEGYREDMIAELELRLKEAREGKVIRRAITMPEPSDHTSDYDRVIAMLNMSVDDEIELDEHEFECFVLDQWGWKASAMHTNMSYVK